MNSALLELEGVSRVFSGDGVATEALADVGLKIGAGEFVCITGASGSGKTTLLNILGCLDRRPPGRTALPVRMRPRCPRTTLPG
ncbi:MAG: ATP-binding cassette domain-containing protein [Gammaproteobacteria bacterium]|nr:ATP-binding cassette domain-containing protein [Gammaproteobacteria bacterium]